jgi:hypothetical protein
MLGLKRPPVRRDPLGASLRFEREDRLDLGERDLQLAQRGDHPRVVELGRRVVPIPGVLVDARGRKQPELVIEPERLGREPGALRELSDAHQIHQLTPRRFG